MLECGPARALCANGLSGTTFFYLCVYECVCVCTLYIYIYIYIYKDHVLGSSKDRGHFQADMNKAVNISRALKCGEFFE